MIFNLALIIVMPKLMFSNIEIEHLANYFALLIHTKQIEIYDVVKFINGTI